MIIMYTAVAAACLCLHCITVEPLNKGHFGNGPFVLCSEVVLISEVCRILTLKLIIFNRAEIH